MVLSIYFRDAGVRRADPLFVAPDRGNYSLRDASPAISKLNFQPIEAIDPLVPHAEDVGADQRWCNASGLSLCNAGCGIE